MSEPSNPAPPLVFRPSGISYLEIPTEDPPRSAAFYVAVFGWQLHGDPDHPSFEDGTGHVIGSWVTTLTVARDAGMLPYIYVVAVNETLDRVLAAGGEIVRAPYPEESLTVATIRDPVGNVVGIWQETVPQ